MPAPDIKGRLPFGPFLLNSRISGNTFSSNDPLRVMSFNPTSRSFWQGAPQLERTACPRSLRWRSQHISPEQLPYNATNAAMSTELLQRPLHHLHVFRHFPYSRGAPPLLTRFCACVAAPWFCRFKEGKLPFRARARYLVGCACERRYSQI